MREIYEVLAQGSKLSHTGEPAVFSARKSSGNRESTKHIDHRNDCFTNF